MDFPIPGDGFQQMIGLLVSLIWIILGVSVAACGLLLLLIWLPAGESTVRREEQDAAAKNSEWNEFLSACGIRPWRLPIENDD